MIEFDGGARVHDQHSVGIHNGVQTVRNRQYRASSEFLSDRVLDQRVGPWKEGGGAEKIAKNSIRSIRAAIIGCNRLWWYYRIRNTV